MGTSSARPRNLEYFADHSRGADGELRDVRDGVSTSYGAFRAANRWGDIDFGSMLSGFVDYIRWNDVDAQWVARIAAAFNQAGGNGDIRTLPDAAIHASLAAAGLLGGRGSVTFDDPVGYGGPPTSGYTNDPVNTASGNFVEFETDLPFAGLAATLRFGRVYNSRSDRAGAFGPGWSSWADTRLRYVPAGCEYVGPDGQRALFPRLGDGYGPVVGVDGLVESGDRGPALRWHRGERWEFDDAGLPLVADRGPGTGIEFSHDDGRLVEVRHAGGKAIRLDWDGDRVTRVGCSDGRAVTYAYDDARRLAAVRRVDGVRSYEVGDNGRVVSVADADGVIEVANAYDDDGRVLRQLSPFGRHTILAYLPGAVTVTADEQGGPDNVFVHDERGRLQAVVDGEGARVSITYDRWGNPATIADRIGAVVVQEWDDRQRLRRRIEPAGAELLLDYDELGRVVEVTERTTGAVTRYTYDAGERTPAAVTDPEGGISRMTVADGLVRRIVDPDGVEVALEFDDDGNIVASIDGDGNVARIERGPEGLPTAAVSPLGRRTTFAYDGARRLVARHDSDGGNWRYEYSAAGRPTAVVDPAGGRREVRYGEHGDPAAHVDALGNVIELGYDVLGNVVATTRDTAAWAFAYDGACRPTAVTDPSGSVWRREYDADGNVLAAIDPSGARFAASYDLAGRPTLVDDGAVKTRLEHDALGRHTALGDVEIEYDRRGLPVARRGPDGAATRYEYTPAGRLARVVEPSGRVHSAYEYDRCGRVAAVVDGAGRRCELCYDADHALVEIRDRSGAVERRTYDDAGRLSSRDAPGRGRTRYAYDPAGRIAAISDGDYGTRRYVYDAAGRLIAASDGNGATTRYDYDADGRLTRIVDPLGATIARTYDALGRVVAETDQLDRTTTVSYDAAGRIAEQTDASGATLRWSWDGAGRLRSIGPADVEPIRVEYDDRGHPARIDEPGVPSIELRYDGSGRLAERRRGDVAMRWRYDADGDRVAMSHPDGSETTYGHDAGGALTSLHHPALGEIALERDAAGRLTGVRGDGMRATWRYESGDLAGFELHAGTTIRTAVLERDPIGRVVAAIVDGAEQRYAYDGAGQLVAAGESTFAYDAGGRLVREDGPAGAVAYQHDAAGQLVRRRAPGGPATEYEHDGAGRRTRETGDGASVAWRWDALGRLAAIEHDGVEVEVEVDALGELASIDGAPVAWDSADPAAPLAWLGGRAVVTAAGEPLAIAGDGAATWLAPDWRGTIGGDRDPWGAPATTWPAALGHRGELELGGAVWLRARPYDPATRAFLAPDPLVHVPGTPCAANPYAFAANDPLGRLDPLGLRPISDRELREIRRRMDRNIFEKANDWVVENWEYLAAGALVVAGTALTFTGVGGAPGVLLIATGAGMAGVGTSVGIQKYATGDVDWGNAMKAGAVSSVAGGAFGTGARFVSALRAGRPWQYGYPGAGAAGATNPMSGQITIRRGMSAAEETVTIRHETVHAVLTSRNPTLAQLRSGAYSHSHLWRYSEEALAEGWATRSLSQGLRFPLGPGYGLSVPRIAAEAGGAGAAAGGAGYGIHEAAK